METISDPAFLRRLEALNRLVRKTFRGELRGESPSMRQGQGTLFRDFRPYSFGDDLRYVDWNIYARLGAMVVKQFEAEENPELCLVLDTSSSMRFGRLEKLQYASVVAAAISYLVLANSGTVRIAFAPPTEDGSLSVFRGIGQSNALFRRLNQFDAASGTDAFRGLIESLQRCKRLSAVVLLSDFYDFDSFSRLAAFLRHRRTRTFCVHVVCREEVAPQEFGDHLVDVESGETQRIPGGPETLAAYRKAFARHCLRVESECRKDEIGYVRVDSEKPYVKTVLDLFGIRRQQA